MDRTNTDSAVVKIDGPRDVLIAARKLIEKEESWAPTIDLVARDRHCVLMALWGAMSSIDSYRAAGRFLKEATGDVLVHRWQDKPERTHAEVLAAFDRAIELAGQQ